MKKNPLVWIIILCPLVTVLLLTQHHIGSPNDESRMATIQALTEYHTFCLDSVHLEMGVDLMYRNGHYQSDKPPMMQILGAVVYYPLYKLGYTFHSHLSLVYYFITFLLVGIPFVIISYLLYKIFLLHELGKSKLYLLFLFAWLGTLLLPFSITFNNHLLTACLILGAVFLYIKSNIMTEPNPTQEKHLRTYFWQGFLLSLALTLEFPPGGLAFVGFLMLIAWRRKNISVIGMYILGAILPLTVHFIFNYIQIGDLKPAYLHREFYNFPDSVWGGELGKKRLFGKTLPGQYFHMLVGYRGIFIFCPMLILGFIESLRIVFKKTHPYRGLAIITLIAFFGTISSYAVQISDFGGGSYGLRWVIGIIPLFIFFTALWMKQNISKAKWVMVGFLLSLSILFSCLGLYNPWPTNILSPSPILENIAYYTFHPRNHQTRIAEMVVEKTSLEPGYSYYELARASREQGALDEAVRYFQLSLKYDPGHTLTYYHLGITLDQINRPDLAVPVYEKLLQLEPDNVGAMNNFGVTLLHLGEYSRAEEIYRKSIQHDPNHFFSHYGMVQALIAQKKYPEALEEAKACLRLNPDSMEAQQVYSKLKLLVSP